MTSILILPFEIDAEPMMLDPAEPLQLPEPGEVVPPAWCPPVATWEDGTAMDAGSLAVILADIWHYDCVATEQAYVATMPDWWVP